MKHKPHKYLGTAKSMIFQELSVAWGIPGDGSKVKQKLVPLVQLLLQKQHSTCWNFLHFNAALSTLGQTQVYLSGNLEGCQRKRSPHSRFRLWYKLPCHLNHMSEQTGSAEGIHSRSGCWAVQYNISSADL